MNERLMLKNRALGGLRAYPKLIWILGFGCLVNVGGLSLLWPVNAIYMHSVLGKSVTVAGFVLMLYSAAGFIGSSVGGWLYDRIGATKTLMGALVLSCIIIIIPAFVTSWWVYILVMVGFGMTCSVPFAALNALGGQAWPDGGRRAFNFLYVANNLGVAVGTALGGLLAQNSFRSVFIGIATAYAVFLLVVFFVLRPEVHKLHSERAGKSRTQSSTGNLARNHASTEGAEPLTALGPVPWVGIGGILFGFMVAWVVYVQWQSTLSVYMQSLHYPLSSYSILWTLNGILIFACQPLVTMVTSRVAKLHWQMVGGIVLYAMAFSVLLTSHSYGVFVAAMVLTTFGEVFVWPAVPAAIALLVPSHRAGLGQGIVQSAATLGRMFGPLYGGWLYDNVGMPRMFFYLLPILVVSILCFLIFRTQHEKNTPVLPPEVAA